ncbi:hypothetical protein B0J14DRAFT_556892 [Halenospora varia]|nr:hypothetical protein B0J14DRAFT_556892 [Halenospora varia]
MLSTLGPQGLFSDNDPIVSTPLGVFSYSPVRDRFGFLLNDGGSASAQDNVTMPLYKKNDNSNYTHYGRSYGVGLNLFSFNETGTMTRISCIKNKTADFHLELDSKSDDIRFPNIYEATGCPPWLPKGYDCGGLVRLCNVTMVPRRFTVNVNGRAGLIKVVPLNDTVNSTNPLLIVTEAFHTTASLSEVASTKFTSAIGNMLNGNINNAHLQQTGENNDTKALRAIAEIMQVLTDDALIAYSSAQIMLAGNTTYVPVHITVDEITIGIATYIYIIARVKAAVVLAVIAEAVRTKGWKGMPRYNYMSVNTGLL